MGLFPVRKTKLVVSDFHLGKGPRHSDGSQNLLEDFHSDREFIDFLDYFSKGPFKRAEVGLVINGDFFNFLQVDYKDRFTDFMTESDSLHKLRRILEGHVALFAKLAEFSREDHHSIVFILGNHDPGLLWEGVQEALRQHLGGRVDFRMDYVEEDGIHIEHGNQYLADNRYDRDQYFLQEGLAEPIINLPFGSFLVIHYINEVKKVRPYFDKVYPFGFYMKWAFFHDTIFAVKSGLKLFFWFLKFLFSSNPARKIKFGQSLSILKDASVHPKLAKEARKILFSRPECRIVVFGHTHQYQHLRFAPGKDYFNTGTWNEKISLDVGSLGRELRLTFVQIDYDKQGIPQGALKEWRGHREPVEDVAF
jgi:UDP-2,3-diacylglucosamine pyrophosphatase LpxH